MDKINATDDPALAKLHGLTHFDTELGQYVAPPQEPEAPAEAKPAIARAGAKTKTDK